MLPGDRSTGTQSMSRCGSVNVWRKHLNLAELACHLRKSGEAGTIDAVVVRDKYSHDYCIMSPAYHAVSVGEVTGTITLPVARR
jgi:hypothetical protein